MNALEMPEKPQKWDWAQWLRNLTAKYMLFPKPSVYGLRMPEAYRIYTTNDCSCFLGEMIGIGGFYSVYESACNHFPEFADSLCVVNVHTNISM